MCAQKCLLLFKNISWYVRITVEGTPTSFHIRKYLLSCYWDCIDLIYLCRWRGDKLSQRYRSVCIIFTKNGEKSSFFGLTVTRRIVDGPRL